MVLSGSRFPGGLGLHAHPDTPYRIGILAKRGDQKVLQRWGPTADYLNQKLAPMTFEIVPLSFESVFSAVKNKEVAFILANSGYYVMLEKEFGVVPIATMRNRLTGNIESTVFGGVLFTSARNEKIREIQDLSGKSLGAVYKHSLGGWYMAHRELIHQGIDPFEFFQKVEFAGTHDAVVAGVLSGKYDAGTVRTDTLERMIEEKRISREDIRVLAGKKQEYFPLMLSTDLYPEWPIARIKSVPTSVSRKVAMALLQMEGDSRAARAAKIAGWTVPMDYSSVEILLRELGVGPYGSPKQLTLGKLVEDYFWWLFLGTILFFVGWLLLIYFIRLNVVLQRHQSEIETLNETLEDKVEARTTELNRFQWIVDTSGDILSFLTKDLVYLEVNKTFLQTFMKEREEVVGKKMEDVLGSDFFRMNLKPRLESCLQGNSVEYDYWYEFPALGWRFMHTVYQPFRTGESGDISGIVISSHDITERKNAQEMLLQLSKDLENRVEKEVRIRREKEQVLIQQSKMAAVGEMIGAIAHQWNQPLNSLGLIIQDLREAQEFGEMNETYIHDAVERSMNLIQYMSRTIEDFRNFHKPSRLKESFSLKKAIQAVIELVSAQMKNHSIKIDVSMEENTEDFFAYGFENESKQVFLNIINNSKDAILVQRKEGVLQRTDPGIIRIELFAREGWIYIVFTDNGGGLEENQVEKVFEPFYSTKGPEGTGIGLYMAKTIIEKNMEGLIQMRNVENGAQVEIRLPMKQSDLRL